MLKVAVTCAGSRLNLKTLTRCVFIYSLNTLNNWGSKAKFTRRTSHAPNRMQMRENKGFCSFAFDSAHVKYGVWTWPKAFEAQCKLLFSATRWSLLLTLTLNILNSASFVLWRIRIWELSVTKLDNTIESLHFIAEVLECIRIPSDACWQANSIWIRYVWTGKSCGFKNIRIRADGA